uniref:Chromatin assembly factor 1 subunit A dimerization domain-containing protein n=1 Tax=Ciona savignyi TaxID=51511 RepID=H2ZDV8_CIOSA
MINIRAKLMQFCENNRPPYYGTYRKRSKYIRPRRPFIKDADLLDYEVDSDDEWEDPADGEDIANSDGEEDGDKDEDKEDDEGDGFFVPHGYLSDDEGIDQDVDEEKGEEEISDQKLKMKQKEFENSFKRKVQVLKIKKIGCVWPSNEAEFQKQDLDFLKTFKMHFITPTPIDLDE